LSSGLTDYVRKYGVDGFRVDTAKHTEARRVGGTEEEAAKAFNDWKKQNTGKKLDDNDFFMVAEVYGYGARERPRLCLRRWQEVDFYANGFESMINFGFKADAKKPTNPSLPNTTRYCTAARWKDSTYSITSARTTTAARSTKTGNNRWSRVPNCSSPRAGLRCTTATRRPAAGGEGAVGRRQYSACLFMNWRP
jgi:hypothetical protein